eukprot:358053-Pyramimonas_sp.AAC.2
MGAAGGLFRGLLKSQRSQPPSPEGDPRHRGSVVSPDCGQAAPVLLGTNQTQETRVYSHDEPIRCSEQADDVLGTRPR